MTLYAYMNVGLALMTLVLYPYLTMSHILYQECMAKAEALLYI